MPCPDLRGFYLAENYNKSLTTVKHGKVDYVALRPIVEGMGLKWSGQQQKLSQNKKRFSCIDIYTTGKDGKQYQMLCIPFKKLNGFLFSINAEKVRKEIKDIVILYQEECSDHRPGPAFKADRF